MHFEKFNPMEPPAVNKTHNILYKNINIYARLRKHKAHLDMLHNTNYEDISDQNMSLIECQSP